ncbi:TPA: hypothetical protein QDB19_004103 [Burkholderia vietnamiensis]|nr:hypothetical protein [Burkholderia vietnamiensis]
MPNDNVLTIPRDLLQDLIDDVSDYAASREFKPREKVWRDDVLARARALLATPLPELRAEVTDEVVPWNRVMSIGLKHGMRWNHPVGWTIPFDDALHGFANDIAREAIDAARTGASS